MEHIDALTRALLILAVAGVAGFVIPVVLMHATGDLNLWSSVRRELSSLRDALRGHVGQHRRWVNPYSADDVMGMVII